MRKIQKRTGNNLKRIINEACRNIRQNFKNFRNTNCENKFLSLNTSNNSLWKFIETLKSRNNRYIPPLHSYNQVIFSNKDKAEDFATNFEQVHCLSNNLGTIENNKHVSGEYNDIINSNFQFTDIKLT